MSASENLLRLTEIAQRLDELSDEGPDELSGLSEKIGVLVDRLSTQILRLEGTAKAASHGSDMPRWLREINNIVEREVRANRGRYLSPDEYLREQSMYDHYRAAVRPRDATFRPLISGV